MRGDEQLLKKGYQVFIDWRLVPDLSRNCLCTYRGCEAQCCTWWGKSGSARGKRAAPQALQQLVYFDYESTN